MEGDKQTTRKKIIVRLRNLISILLISAILTTSFTFRIFASDAIVLQNAIENSHLTENNEENNIDEGRVNIVTESNANKVNSNNIENKNVTDNNNSVQKETYEEDNANVLESAGQASKGISEKKQDDNIDKNTKLQPKTMLRNVNTSSLQNSGESTQTEAKTETTEKDSETNSEQTQQNEFNVTLKVNEQNSSYTWNAQINEQKEVKFLIDLQNTSVSRNYAKDEIQIQVTGIGNINRTSNIRANAIKVDEYEKAEKQTNWSYKYNEETDNGIYHQEIA